MNKKTYQTPEINVMAIRQEQVLLAGSANAAGLDGFGGWGGVSDDEDNAD